LIDLVKYSVFRQPLLGPRFFSGSAAKAFQIRGQSTFCGNGFLPSFTPRMHTSTRSQHGGCLEIPAMPALRSAI
jgi:hypothetical protein